MGRLVTILQTLPTLKTRLAQLAHVEQAAGLLSWDQQTYMPAGAAEGRAEQLATLSQLAHQMLTGDEMGRLLQLPNPKRTRRTRTATMFACWPACAAAMTAPRNCPKIW